MKTSLTLIAALALGATFAARAAGTSPEWNYADRGGAAHWSELDKSFETCKIGKHQSPINIVTKGVKPAAADVKPVSFSYTAGAGEVVNNGHTVQVNLPASGSITLDGTEYKLVQFHFHTPSEEKVDGKAYPLVAHLVHKSAEGKLAVVAVLFKQGKENATLKPVFAKLPAKEGDKVALEGTIDVAALLPADHAYYSFPGSLTTPPCSEEVRWQVLKTPVEISGAQLAAFRKLYKMNARPVQPLNDRAVLLVK